VPHPSQELEEALAAVAAALGAGDAEASERASARAAAACQALAAAGTRLPADQLTRLARLQAGCEAAAGEALARLGGALSAAARSTRAAAAYRR